MLWSGKKADLWSIKRFQTVSLEQHIMLPYHLGEMLLLDGTHFLIHAVQHVYTPTTSNNKAEQQDELCTSFFT